MRARAVVTLYDEPSLPIVTLYDEPFLAVLLLQASLGMLALTFARGAITWLALYGKQRFEDGDAREGFGAACRATLARFPALLAGSLLYGIVITAGILTMSELTQKLEFVPDKMAHVWSGPHRAFGDVLRQLEWRGFNVLLPNPGFISIGEEVIKTQGNPLMAVAGVALVFVAETLLRLRTVMALKPFGSPRSKGFGLFAPLLDSTRFGLKHFVVITVHLWLLRLATLALTVALVEFPVAMMDHFITPNVMRFGGDFAVLPILRFMAAASVALVNAILLALSVTYDAHLFKQLIPSSAARAMGADIHVAVYTSKIAPREPAC